MTVKPIPLQVAYAMAVKANGVKAWNWPHYMHPRHGLIVAPWGLA